MTPSSSNIAGLPLGISFSNGSSVSYGYGFTRGWCSDAIYENGTARMLLHEEGYLDLSTGGSNPPARFFVKDHLGSVRAVVAAGGAIQESTDYYPLGGMFNAGTSIQPHKFSGKEWDSFSGLNTFDFGARTYDPYTGRWLTQDPMANKYFAHSPYVYCAGNPVRYVDLDGRKLIVGNRLGRILSYFGVNNYEHKVSRDLETLKKLDSEVENIISRMEDTNDLKFRIKMPIKGHGNAYSHDRLTIYYNPDSRKTYTIEDREPIVGLSHELGHAEDEMNGKPTRYDRNLLRLGREESEEGHHAKNIVNAVEYNGIRVENRIRSALCIEDREFDYFKTNSYKKREQE